MAPPAGHTGTAHNGPTARSGFAKAGYGPGKDLPGPCFIAAAPAAFRHKTEGPCPASPACVLLNFFHIFKNLRACGGNDAPYLVPDRKV